MAASKDDVFRTALALSDSDRAELIAKLIQSLDSEAQPGVQDAWREEINRRVDELESGSVETLTLDTIRDRMSRAQRG